jgi:hypothetical protein
MQQLLKDDWSNRSQLVDLFMARELCPTNYRHVNRVTSYFLRWSFI